MRTTIKTLGLIFLCLSLMLSNSSCSSSNNEGGGGGGGEEVEIEEEPESEMLVPVSVSKHTLNPYIAERRAALSYNSDGRLASYIIHYDYANQNKFSGFDLIYNNDKSIKEIKIYYDTYSKDVFKIWDLTYSENKIMVAERDQDELVRELTMDNGGRMMSSRSIVNGEYQPTTEYVYDALSNDIRVKKHIGTENEYAFIREFDSEKGVYKNIGTPKWLLSYFFNYFVPLDKEPYGTTSNLIKSHQERQENVHTTYKEFVFNDKGYPTYFIRVDYPYHGGLYSKQYKIKYEKLSNIKKK